jgi:hypothetical protein
MTAGGLVLPVVLASLTMVVTDIPTPYAATNRGVVAMEYQHERLKGALLPGAG